MENKNLKERFVYWIKSLPNKKHHVEFITALLSVPVLITVIMINLNNLSQNRQAPSKTVPTTPIKIIITGGIPQSNSSNIMSAPTIIDTPTLTSTTSAVTTTPFPTYTPYPTYTPFPTIPVATNSAGH